MFNSEPRQSLSRPTTPGGSRIPRSSTAIEGGAHAPHFIPHAVTGMATGLVGARYNRPALCRPASSWLRVSPGQFDLVV